MKKIKRIIALGSALSMCFLLASCEVTPTAEDETATVHFETADEAFEAMTGAADEGDYKNAVKYYNSGAADSANADTLNWYYYSLAANANASKGCLGYPLDLLLNQIDEDFQPSKAKMGELMISARSFNGTYNSGNTYFLYIADGKIAVGDGIQLSGKVICTDELLYRDGVYYWARHVEGGEDQLLYTIELSDSGVIVRDLDGGNEGMYIGSYSVDAAEMPEMYY